MLQKGRATLAQACEISITGAEREKSRPEDIVVQAQLAAEDWLKREVEMNSEVSCPSMRFNHVLEVREEVQSGCGVQIGVTIHLGPEFKLGLGCCLGCQAGKENQARKNDAAG
jgi:hypothetical protein